MGVQARCGSGYEIIENKLGRDTALRCRLLEGLQSFWVGLLRALRPLPDRVAESGRVRGSFLEKARYILGRGFHDPYSPATGGLVLSNNGALKLRHHQGASCSMAPSTGFGMEYFGP
jgi:hypothetical protein